MIMKRLLVSSLALALAACSTYGETQSRAPMIELRTEATADQYLGCVAPRFAEMWVVAVIPDGDARVLTAQSAGAQQIAATVTVRSDESGSHVAYRQMHDLSWNAYGRMQQIVRDCAG